MDYRKYGMSETILTTIVAILVMTLVWGLLSGAAIIYPGVAAIGLVIIAFVVIRSTLSPDQVRATQISKTLKFASQTLEHMRSGLDSDSAQAVCDILLPSSQARAISITDTQTHLGFTGNKVPNLVTGKPLMTKEIHHVLQTREMMIITNSQTLAQLSEQIGFRVEAVVITPLVIRDNSVGTLKFYYSARPLVDKTQIAIVRGLSELLSTQLSLSELDRQSELATRAELRALQSQINPHFLFNTINTIASLIRTDPKRARELLREFAQFYRQTLENSETAIPLSREIVQTMRYVTFEKARFGEDKIVVKTDIDPEFEETLVPSFIIQPIIENSIQHGMRDGVPLTIQIKVYKDGEDVVISVADDGIGMNEAQLKALGKTKPNEKGTGIALKNVAGRLRGYFDSDSSMVVRSEPNEGTVTTLHLGGAAEQQGEDTQDA
ncbi:MAG: histidine kinase [Coriobacteriia bacterium]|nr:histidine kinase [Coriobacteriia bacterium]